MPAELTKEQWDALCDGCGLCCGWSNCNVACPGLNTATNQCKVWDTRLTTHVCSKLTPDNIAPLHAVGQLPDTCGYVRYILKGVPYEESRLDHMKNTARYIPFEEAPPIIKSRYYNQRKIWFAKIERSNKS